MANASAFDEVAAGYDSVFTDTHLARMLRQRVWQMTAELLRPGERVLELACGTGEDALWLARHGVKVVAIDGASEMVRVARQKVSRAGLAPSISVHHGSLQQLGAGLPPWANDLGGVFSNFGGLNTIGEWRPLARSLAAQVRPGGWALLVVMGPICPWEIVWHLLHGQGRQALRRMLEPAQARVGGRMIPVWYPSPRRLAQAFAPWFAKRQTQSLGLWLPPCYLGHLVSRLSGLFGVLNRIERATAHLTGGWGDHYMLVLERRR
jgi:SAM-dependent methyltransferase